jgi:non-specific serine/threonine protein kinase
MLETVREFGLERLEASGDSEEIRRRHAAWCLALADRAETVAGWGGPGEKRWLDRLEAELPNLRAALAWLELTGDAEAGMALAGALVGLWHFRGHRAEGRAWLESALARGGEAPSPARAKALLALGVLERFVTGGRDVALIAESQAMWRDLGDARRAAVTLVGLGIGLGYLAEHERSVPVLEEAAALLDRLGEPALAAIARLHLGVAALEVGDGARGEAILEEVLSVFRREGHRWAVGGTLQALGQAAEERGDRAGAAARYAESLAVWAELGSRDGLPDTLNGAARLAAADGRPGPAARLLGAAAALGENLENVPRPAERVRTERAAARAARGGAGFAAAWAAGRALTIERAAAEATAVLATIIDPAAPTGAAGVDAFGLTPRELEVLRLVARGRSNEEIGDALFISPRTAQTHLTHLLAKLGLPSRTAAAAFAHEHGLA